MKSDLPFYNWKPFEKQSRVLLSPAHVKGLVGANRVGKTETASYMAVARAIGFDPALSRIAGEFIFYDTPAHVWCVSLDTNVSRDVIEHKVRHFIPSEEIKAGHAGYKARDKMYFFKNGSTLGFKSCDSGADKFQGTERNLIVFDEEPPEDVFDECLMRILTVRGSLVFSFTPLKGSEWLHELLYDSHHLGLSKLGVFTQEIGMADNPYIPADQVAAAKERFKRDPVSLDIRVHGKYRVMTLGKVFSKESLDFQQEVMDHEKAIVPPHGKLKGVGYLKEDLGIARYTFVPSVGVRGKLTIFEFPDPNREYAIGADIADGNPLGDWSVAQVLDAKTLEQVAVWRGRLDPAEFGHELVCLGRYYNDATVAPETNRSGAATVHVMKSEIYPKIFAMPTHLKTATPKRLASWKASQAAQHARDMGMRGPQLGWRTDPRTKPLMINDLKYHLNHFTTRVNDETTLDELRAYAYLNEDAPSTMHGIGVIRGHDDCADAYAIALQVALSISSEIGAKESPFVEKTVEELIVEQVMARQQDPNIDADDFNLGF